MSSSDLIKSGIYCFLGAVAIGVAAQITIPLPLIPITAQSLVVLLVGYGLKSRLAVIAIVLYLLLGIVGIPVFADASAGWEKIAGNSGGFLYGFIIGAYAVGKLSEQGWAKKIPKSLAAMSIGTAIILLTGVTHLSYYIGWSKAIEYGLQPFIAGAIVKIALGALIMWQAERRLNP